MAVILAGGEGERLSILSQERAKPAVPFGGKYRIIDFTLSNCVNSDIDDVVVLTQYNPRSLNDHIGLGRPWDLDRNHGGVKLLQPYIARGRVAEWYRGTADAVLRNINVLEHDPADTVLVLAGDHIYKMDYQPFVAAHRRHRADVTIAVRRVPLAEASRMGILALDDDRPGHRVAGEAQAAQERPRLDGRLRLLEEGAPALAERGPRRLRGQRHPGDARRRRARLRLPLQRLLAGRRDDPVVLGGQHGPPRGRPGARPVRQGLGHPHPVRGARPGQGRARRRRSTGASSATAASSTGRSSTRVLSPGVRVGRRARSCATRSSCSTRSSARAPSSTGRSSTRRSSSGQGAIVGDGPYDDRPNKQRAGPPEHRHHRRRQAGGHPARRAHRPQREDRARTSARPTSSERVVRSGESVERGEPARPRRAAADARRPGGASPRRAAARPRGRGPSARLTAGAVRGDLG